MVFNKAHYVRAMLLIRSYLEAARQPLVEVFCGFFGKDNPRFDAGKFRAVCERGEWLTAAQYREYVNELRLAAERAEKARCEAML